jgi:hypothetical protein
VNGLLPYTPLETDSQWVYLAPKQPPLGRFGRPAIVTLAGHQRALLQRDHTCTPTSCPIRTLPTHHRRHLYTENVLLDEAIGPKLTGFRDRLARSNRAASGAIPDTPAGMRKADVYSFGILTFEIAPRTTDSGSNKCQSTQSSTPRSWSGERSSIVLLTVLVVSHETGAHADRFRHFQLARVQMLSQNA